MDSPTVPGQSGWLYTGGRDGYSAQGTPYQGLARDEDARAPRADEGTYTRENPYYRETSIENAMRLTRGPRKHRT